jgi:hypothetical protein
MIEGRARYTLPCTREICAAALLCSLLATAGCVDHNFIIETNVPNSEVYIDNVPVGPAPACAPFTYSGYYEFTIVHPGYETLTQRVHVTAPWYDYPPLDFFAEVLWPFHIRDKKRYYFNLKEITKPRVDEIINNADALRERGYNLPAPAQPAPPKPPPVRVVQPQDGMAPTVGPGAPPVGAQPGAIVPSVGPQLTPQGPSSGAPVPSVLPPGP